MTFLVIQARLTTPARFAFVGAEAVSAGVFGSEKPSTEIALETSDFAEGIPAHSLVVLTMPFPSEFG